MNNFGEKVSFIWSVADLLRGPYKPPQYGRVILPLTVLRRLDCVLAPTKDKVLAKAESLKGGKVENIEPILNRVSGVPFHNTSKLDFGRLKGEPDKIAANLTRYIKSFSSKAREILEYFGFEAEIAKLDEADRLYLVVSKFCDIDLHPVKVPNIEMGYIFEELIRKFNEAANETAGDHFTPREIIRLMVNLLFDPDAEVLTKKGIVRTLLDPASGTGGMLSVGTDYLHELNPDARLEVFGQDWNKESYAVCGSDMLIKGQNIDHIVYGSSFSKDGFAGQRFDYMLANPPFGVEWKPDEDFIVKEHETQGYTGRFGAGLPRIDNGSLLFLQHMISKMKTAKEGGSRIAIVFNGSPLFTGDAASGESEIRRWIIENDWLEAIVAMPDQLFYNTGILTYVWVVTNRKRAQRKGKVQLINAVGFFQKMWKSLGSKRNEIGDGSEGKPDHISEITKLYGSFAEGEHVKIFDNTDFAFRQVTIERPLRLNFQASPERIARLPEQTAFQNLAKSKKKGKVAEQEIAEGKHLQDAILATLAKLDASKLYRSRNTFCADLEAAYELAGLRLSAAIRKAILAALCERDATADICRDSDGNPEPDAELRDCENVPFKQDVTEYFEREVKPHVSDAWVNETVRDEADGKVGRVGYEIPFTRHFYQYAPPRSLERIEADIAGLETHIVELLMTVTHDRAADSHNAVARHPDIAGVHKPYPEYSDSTCPWLRHIPSHWALRKLKFIARIRPSNVDKKSEDGQPSVSLCNYVDVYKNEYIVPGIEFMAATATPIEIARFRLRSGDVLITKDSEEWNDIAVPAYVTQDFPNVLCGYHLAQVRPFPDMVDGEYLFRAFMAGGVSEQFQVSANGVTRYGLSLGAITSVVFPLPPLQEQHAISTFLSDKLRRIDQLLAGLPLDASGDGLLVRFGLLLHEYRSALITAAVTGQIDVRHASGKSGESSALLSKNLVPRG